MSIDLYGLPDGIWFKGQFIKEGDGLYLGTSDEFFRGGLDGISRCLKANGQDAGVCVRYENIRIMKERDFHRYCRVVYRAMRKQYGKEKVQDECLRVFKVFFPLLHKARTTGEYGFDELAMKRTLVIFESWKPEKDSCFDKLLGEIMDRMEEPFTKEEFIQFCEDCLVVVMRIRKLSPREVYRLQGVGEKDIDTLLNSGLSKSAHYKLAGNSITSGGNLCDSQGNWDGPLFNLFRKMFIEPEPDMVKGEAMQLSLF